jgi:hypothetical protein
MFRPLNHRLLGLGSIRSGHADQQRMLFLLGTARRQPRIRSQPPLTPPWYFLVPQVYELQH